MNCNSTKFRLETQCTTRATLREPASSSAEFQSSDCRPALTGCFSSSQFVNAVVHNPSSASEAIGQPLECDPFGTWVLGLSRTVHWILSQCCFPGLYPVLVCRRPCYFKGREAAASNWSYSRGNGLIIQWTSQPKGCALKSRDKRYGAMHDHPLS